MAIKLIATDLDGTLMAPDHMTVTERTKKALFEAHEKGTKIVIATGRALDFIGDVTAQIPFVDYIIYCNGAAVYDRNACAHIYQSTVSPEVTREFVEYINRRPIHYHIYKDGHSHIQRSALNYAAFTGLPQAFLEDYMSKVKLCDDINEVLAGECAQVIDLFSVPEEYQGEIKGMIAAHNLVSATAVPGEVAITAHGADKGSAIRALCSELSLTTDEVMTFGDASNDCPMLEIAGYSFAMENGAEVCKKTAKFVAPSNAEDGVAQMVEKYVLDK